MTQPTPNKSNRPVVSERGKKLNSLRLDDRMLNLVLDRLDTEADGQAPSANRTYVRWPFRHTNIEVTLTHPGGSRAVVLMACRNLSCGGISLLHSAFIHNGTPVEVNLPHPFRDSITLGGKVTRCRHRGGLLHEIGVKFNKQINVRDYVRPDPFREYFSLERVDPAQLRGTVLYVEDSVLDQRIVKHYLRESSLTVKTATTAPEALAIGREGVDLIISDYELPDCPGKNFLDEVRAAGISAPVVMITPDNSTATRNKVRDWNADAYLAKPLTQDRVLRAVAEFMLVARPAGLMSSTLNASAPQYAQVTAFVDRLHGFAKELEELVKSEKTEECLTICQQIQGAAPTLGFESIARLAGRSVEVLVSTGSLKDAARPVQELISACDRVAA